NRADRSRLGRVSWTRPLVLIGLLGVPAQLRANPIDVPIGVQRMVRAATVEVLPARCAGAVPLPGDLIVPARHCATHVGDGVSVRRGEEEEGADVVAVDEVADQSVLRVGRALPTEPLAIAAHLPIEGTVLFFAGNLRQAKWQS